MSKWHTTSISHKLTINTLYRGLIGINLDVFIIRQSVFKRAYDEA